MKSENSIFYDETNIMVSLFTDFPFKNSGFVSKFTKQFLNSSLSPLVGQYLPGETSPD